MKPNLRLKAAVLEAVETQLRDNDPPETARTLKRLIESGYSRPEAMELIGTAVAAEMFHVMKEGKPYNAQRYIAALDKLPKVTEE